MYVASALPQECASFYVIRDVVVFVLVTSIDREGEEVFCSEVRDRTRGIPDCST